jgi:predicted DCC family thiol-disulfide oxidoreductase YuxK
MLSDSMPQAASLTVLYDGACPLCRREIGVYRGLQPLRSDAPVCFADVNDPALTLPGGTTRAQLLARFHVRGHDGQLLSGARAFLALWAALPGWRWLALVGRLHPMTSIALVTGASGGIGRDIDRLADVEALLRSAAATYTSQGLRVNAVAPTD